MEYCFELRKYKNKMYFSVFCFYSRYVLQNSVFYHVRQFEIDENMSHYEISHIFKFKSFVDITA